MPNYNKGPFAEEAVGSVLSQKGVDAELIFVDDASTDGSADAVKTLSKTCVGLKVIFLSKNSGGAAARNVGMANARGEFLFFMDSDDLMEPDALASAVSQFEAQPDLDFAVFPMGFFNRNPGDDDRRTGLSSGRSALVRFFERDHPWLISSPLWKRVFIEEINGFDERLTSQQDFDLHVRALIKGGRYRYFESPILVHYRMEVDSIPRSTSQSLLALRMRAEMVRRHLDLMVERGIESKAVKRAAARYLLDVAQMIRWHKTELGAASTGEGLKVWLAAHEYGLVSPREYADGMGYIRFKNNMVWNRFPRMQRRIERRFCKKLGYLVSSAKKATGKKSSADD